MKIHTVRVALDLSNHLLQAPDSLLATLLWHLALEVVSSALAGLVTLLAGSVLVLIWNVLLGNTLEVVKTGTGPLASVNVVTLVGGVLTSVGSSSDVVPAERLLLVESLLKRVL